VISKQTESLALPVQGDHLRTKTLFTLSFLIPRMITWYVEASCQFCFPSIGLNFKYVRYLPVQLLPELICNSCQN